MPYKNWGEVELQDEAFNDAASAIAEESLVPRWGKALDAHLIADSWLNSYQSARRVTDIRPDVFKREHDDFIQRLLQKSDCLIICDALNEDKVVGWAVYSHLEGGAMCLHYAYVIHRYRQRGVFNAMLKIAGATTTSGEPPNSFVYTHDTPSMYAYTKSHDNKVLGVDSVYNPYIGNKIAYG